MAKAALWVIVFFLPVFPATLLFSYLYRRLSDPRQRAAMIVLWPQLGVLLLWLFQPQIPAWLGWAALFSAAFYGFRALVLKGLDAWAGFMALSLLPLAWLLPSEAVGSVLGHVMMLLVTLPLAVLVLLAAEISDRYGAAYLGLTPGLLAEYPRLTGLLVTTLLAVLATPPFPAFFVMLGLLTEVGVSVAVGLLLVWYLWGWSGVRVFQQLAMGEEAAAVVSVTAGDVSCQALWRYGALLAGIGLSGVVLVWSMAGGV